MVNCAVYHEFERKQNTYAIIDTNGDPDLLEDVFGLLEAIPMEAGPLLAALRGTIIADLNPAIDQCIAMGPYSLKDPSKPNTWTRGHYGELVQRAKYYGDERPLPDLSDDVAALIRAHPRLSQTTLIVATTIRDSNALRPIVKLPDLVAGKLELGLVRALATRDTAQQNDAPQGASQREMRDNVADSMRFGDEVHGERVLIVDDVLGSGQTLREMGRALRQAGAHEVMAVCMAKDAKFTYSQLSWDKNQWPENA